MMYDKRRHTHGNRSPRYSLAVSVQIHCRPNPDVTRGCLYVPSRDQTESLSNLGTSSHQSCRQSRFFDLFMPTARWCAEPLEPPIVEPNARDPATRRREAAFCPVDNVQLMQVIAITTGVVERWRALLRSSKGIEKSNKRSTARDSRLADAKEGVSNLAKSLYNASVVRKSCSKIPMWTGASAPGPRLRHSKS